MGIPTEDGPGKQLSKGEPAAAAASGPLRRLFQPPPIDDPDAARAAAVLAPLLTLLALTLFVVALLGLAIEAVRLWQVLVLGVCSGLIAMTDGIRPGRHRGVGNHRDHVRDVDELASQ